MKASAGDSVAAQERLQVLGLIPLLDIGHADVDPLAQDSIDAHLLPEKAAADARHVAVSAVFGVEYLLTWNCKHLANADLLPKVYAFLRAQGYCSPLIITPEEFSGRV